MKQDDIIESCCNFMDIVLHCKIYMQMVNKTEKIFSIIGCAKSDKYYKKVESIYY